MLASGVAAAICSAMTLAAAPAAAGTGHCGAPLSATEVRTIIRLSDTATINDPTWLARLDDAAARNHAITAILVAHRDWRGLFDIGLDAVEYWPVLPLQHQPGAFTDPRYAHAVSYELLRRYLANLHAEFTGGPVEPQWARYYELTTRCDLSPARVAMAGYNAHLTVDLPHTVAAVGTGPGNAADFFRIVDAIARAGGEIIERTKQVYHGDLGPLWRFYFVGAGLDRLFGRGVATGPLLEAADSGYNVIVFANGLALENAGIRPAASSEITQLWWTDDWALGVLAGLGGL
jgi:hypothetical protein